MGNYKCFDFTSINIHLNLLYEELGELRNLTLTENHFIKIPWNLILSKSTRKSNLVDFLFMEIWWNFKSDRKSLYWNLTENGFHGNLTLTENVLCKSDGKRDLLENGVVEIWWKIGLMEKGYDEILQETELGI